ncbi:MAG TPA: hypothetical protein VE309_05515, partial [Caulobacteraceae bacterium]|nr:hypothetical protein [Caulobacteraceae bacterium]
LKILVLHAEQNRCVVTLPGESSFSQVMSDPSTLNRSSLIGSCTTKAPPDMVWHSRQWQA